MKPLGRAYFKNKGSAKVDFHPPNGYINWWEVVVTPNKKRARRQAKKEIKNSIEMIS